MSQKVELDAPENGRVVEDPYRQVSRRTFLSWLAVGWASFGTAMAILGGALQRFLFPNVLREPPQQFYAGFPVDLAEGAVDESYKDAYGVWLVKDRDPITGKHGVYALSTICTHLGCTPSWLPSEEKFKCPCHGSGYKKSGMNFEGPAPRPLERYRVVLADDGRIYVDKSRKFQFEKGQWVDPEALLPV